MYVYICIYFTNVGFRDELNQEDFLVMNARTYLYFGEGKTSFSYVKVFFFLLWVWLTKAPKRWFYSKHVVKDFCFWKSWLMEKSWSDSILSHKELSVKAADNSSLTSWRLEAQACIISNGPAFITMKLLPVSETGYSICQLASSLLLWILIIFTTIKLCVTVMLCIWGAYSALQMHNKWLIGLVSLIAKR